MTSKKQCMIVYVAAALLLFVAIVCYAAFPAPEPETPIRLMYQTNAGKVLFDHHTHTSENGFALDCYDCHHHTPDDEAGLIACGQCHLQKIEEGVVPESCLECHDESEVEDSEYPKRADALHAQCSTCHLEFGNGPVHQDSLNEQEKEAQKTEPNDWVDCSKCHVI
jgi:uncharacterized membrane protein